MMRHRLLLSGNFKESKEKSSFVGYDLDFDATSLPPDAYHTATVPKNIERELDAIVALGYYEAVAIH